jgi:hypothetical protein
VADDVRYEVRFDDGEVEVADSLWAAHHLIARRAAFADDPLRPHGVFPVRISKLGKQFFGGRVFVSEVGSAAELSSDSAS